MSTDRVIEPGQTVVVNVRCVEIDRDGGSLYFKGGKAMAELSLRRAVAYEPQENVWGQVDVINARQGLHPQTKTYRYAAQAQVKGANLARRDRILAELGRREEHDHLLGMAVAVDNEIVAVERFATPELYRRLEPELLASYVIATDGKAKEGKALTPTDVRAFVASVKPSSTAASTVQLKARPAREQIAYNYASE